jgi:hypothetical protein
MNRSFTANESVNLSELFNRSANISEYPSIGDLNSTAGVYSINTFTDCSEFPGCNEPYTLNTAASVFTGTNRLTNLETTWDANIPNAVDDSLCVDYPAVSASSTSDVDRAYGVNNFVNANNFVDANNSLWTEELLSLGVSSYFDSPVCMGGLANGSDYSDDAAFNEAVPGANNGFNFA